MTTQQFKPHDVTIETAMGPMSLAEVLDLHRRCLRFDPGGCRLWLHCAEIGAVDLRHATLAHARMTLANLEHAALCHADLRHAELDSAEMAHADLSGANLSHASLCGADLRGATLTGASLRHADLSSAILDDADLTNADLSHAVLWDTTLNGAALGHANLCEAQLGDADTISATYGNGRPLGGTPTTLCLDRHRIVLLETVVIISEVAAPRERPFHIFPNAIDPWETDAPGEQAMFAMLDRYRDALRRIARATGCQVSF